MEVIMRRARRTDADAINRIINQVIEDGDSDSDLDIDIKEKADQEQWLSGRDRRHPVYVGEVDGRVVCWVALEPYSLRYPYDGVAELALYVDREFRRYGLSGLLLKFIEQQASNLGYYKIILSVYASNLQALHAYRRAGYRDVGVFRNHGYHKGKLHDMIFMERLLPVDMDGLNRYYRQHYPFYEEFFRQEDALYEAQMLRNGMVRSEEDPSRWVSADSEGVAGYLDDWNGQTVRVAKNAPSLEPLPSGEGAQELPPAAGEEAVLPQPEGSALPPASAAPSSVSEDPLPEQLPPANALQQ